MGAELKRCHAVDVIGIELDRNLAKEAEQELDRVVQADAIAGVEVLAREKAEVQAVILADILEHLAIGDASKRYRLMPRGGWIVASLPNVAHLDTFINLLRGTRPYRSRGIHD